MWLAAVARASKYSPRRLSEKCNFSLWKVQFFECEWVGHAFEEILGVRWEGGPREKGVQEWGEPSQKYSPRRLSEK